MAKYGLIGEKLPHSFSPIIHKEFGMEEYALWEVPKKKIGSFLENASFDAANVTIPYKENALRACIRTDEASGMIGAVNTLVRKKDGLCGYNTDLFGFINMCRSAGIRFEGKKAVILGSGGTSKTACFAAFKMGAERAVVVSRSASSYEIRYDFPVEFVSYEEKDRYTDADILINTTPVGMYPNIDEIPVELDIFEKLKGVVDVIYNPLTTVLVAKARERGIPAVNGFLMLVGQAYLAERYFFGQNENLGEKETGIIDDVYQKLLKTKQNIVLVGMPGSGKSTVGKILAQKTGREFRDADEEFERVFGISPGDYIKNYGEDEFRDKEEEVIGELSKLTGCVISTGGGSVKRRENVFRLKQSGIAVFLKRPLEELSTKGRPLSKDMETLKKMYEERLPLYLSASDYSIDVRYKPEATVEALMKELRIEE